MVCPYCGSDISDTADVCPYCGESVASKRAAAGKPATRKQPPSGVTDTGTAGNGSKASKWIGRILRILLLVTLSFMMGALDRACTRDSYRNGLSSPPPEIHVDVPEV